MSCYKWWPRTVPRTRMSSGSWCFVGSLKFPKLWRLQERSSPACRGRSPPASPGKAVKAQPEVSPPAQPRQPWGHAPPGSTKQLQCRRGSGSPVYGRSAHWTPSRRSGADRWGCVPPRTSEYLFCPPQAASLPPPASRLPVSSSSRENTGAQAKDSWAPARLLVLTHCLALLSHFNLSVPSSLPGKGQGSCICLGKQGLFGRAEASALPRHCQPSAGDRAKCKGHGLSVARGVLLLIFNLRPGATLLSSARAHPRSCYNALYKELFSALSTKEITAYLCLPTAWSPPLRDAGWLPQSPWK